MSNNTKMLRDSFGDVIPQVLNVDGTYAALANGDTTNIDFNDYKLIRDSLGEPIPYQYFDVQQMKFVPGTIGGGDGGSGEPGEPGKSAYEVAVQNGFVGSEAQWLASLKGEPGPTGPTGPAGKDGSDANEIEIPSYWESHLTSKINRIRQLQDEDGVNRFSVGFITDMHLEGNNEKHSGNLMRKIDDEVSLSIIINGGDCIAHNDGPISKANAIRQIRDMFKMFSPRLIDKMLYTTANHDDNSHSNQVWNETLKEGELYSQFFRYLDNKVVRGKSPRYYYMDNEFHKTRFIVLDCNDVPYVQTGNMPKYPISVYHAFRQMQLEWFADEALNIPDNSWSVMVVSHAPPYEPGVVGFDRSIRNAEMALGILAAFRDKTTYTGSSLSTIESDFQSNVSVDFTGKGGEVICWLAGDTHTDNIVKMTPYADIHLVTTLNDHRRRTSPSPTGVVGTTTEQAFDILTIDKANKNVHLTRIGAGSERQFSYFRDGGNNSIFTDNFNRQDSNDLGSPWSTYQGQFYIRNNKARSVRAAEWSLAEIRSSSIVNVGTQDNISIESSIFTSDGEGILFRHLDEFNYYRLMLENGNVELLIKENDENLTVGSMPNLIQDKTYIVRIELRGPEIKVFLDDSLIISHESSKFLTSTDCGIRAWSEGSTSGEYDYFTVKSLV